ncbi:tetratricopeptide repeat-containing sensor histidine kinase [Tenacibaculum agarivorans]|uniref:tetratricopeptide repeat-containing sensor histidine kinase n=1 Tax=Tenacibaculum agarivorans TaxID=1908389 RepID=UPI0009F9CDE9|nr:tetratricopeptide repeat protein [Tenacibaculum agarivorans]
MKTYINSSVKKSCVYLLLLLSNALISQSVIVELDSLKSVLSKHVKEDSTRVILLNTISYKNYGVAPEEVNNYANKAKLLAEKIGFTKGEARSMYLISVYHLSKGDLKGAFSAIEQSLELYKKINESKGISTCYDFMGTISYYQGNYDKSIEYYEKALQLARKLGSKKKEADFMNNIGNINSASGKLDDAIRYYNEVIAIYEEINDKKAMLTPLNNIAVIYNRQGKHLDALAYFKESLEINRKLENKKEIAGDLLNMGAVYSAIKDYKKAEKSYKESLLIFKELNDQHGISSCIISMANIYRNSGDYKVALEYLNEALNNYKEIDSKKGMLTTYHNIGAVYFKQSDFKNALKNYQIALNLAEDLGEKRVIGMLNIDLAQVYFQFKDYTKSFTYATNGKKIADELSLLEAQREANSVMTKLYRHKGDYKRALEHHILYKKLNDSLFNKENVKKIAELEYEYKYKEKLQLANYKELQLTQEVEKTALELAKSKQNLLIGIIVFLIVSITLGGIILYQKLKNIRSVNENILMEQKLLRSQMTPHFIFNCLSVLQGVILNKEIKNAVKYLSRFSKLLRITLENSRDKMVPLKKELEALQHYVVVQSLGVEKPFDYTIHKAEEIQEEEVLVPPMLIQPFVENALEHAFEEEQVDRKINVNLEYKNNQLVCVILDNGVGIASKKQSNTVLKKSLATTITKDRLKMLSKEFQVDSSISIKDRKEINEQGTQVVLKLPYKKITND